MGEEERAAPALRAATQVRAEAEADVGQLAVGWFAVAKRDANAAALL